MPRFPAAAAAALAAVALLLITGLPGTLADETCATYVPDERCLFAPEIKVASTRCKPVPCEYNLSEAYGSCGFPESGTYVTSSSSFCTDAFMSTRRANATACGKGRCCLTDLRGTFSINGQLPSGAPRYEFRPVYPRTCRFTEMTRGQLMSVLERINAPLVVMGDSMMRQLYLRLVLMMRGQHRTLDYKMHTHAMYHTCDEADAFRISRNNGYGGVGNSAYDPEYLSGPVIGKFFEQQEGPGLVAFQRSLKRCKKAPVKLHYLMAPTYLNQTLALKRYMAFQAKSSSVKPILVLSVGYWEVNPEAYRPAYLEALLSLKKRVSKVFLVGVASKYAKEGRRKQEYQSRNSVVRDWAAAQGEPFQYVSYDMLTEIPYPRPPAPPGGDKHWM